MLDHFIRSYAANEQVIYLRLRRRPPATGSASFASSFEDKNENHEFDFGGVTGTCDGGLPEIGGC